MKRVALLIFLGCACGAVAAQNPPVLTFPGQPVLEQGIPVEPYALFYEDLTRDTLQSPDFIQQQPFVPPAKVPHIRSGAARQMEATSQVFWFQFRVANTHLTDTLRLWYAGDIHPVYSLYQKNNASFDYLGSRGFCVPAFPVFNGISALPITVPPQTTHHYFVRVADYLLLLGNIAGQLHTRQSYLELVTRQLMLDRWLMASMAIILGCLLLMGGYAFFLYVLNRDLAFLYYTLYTAVACCFILVLGNPRFSLGLTPLSLPWLGHPIALSLNPILGLLYALFITKLLSIPHHQPLLWRVIKVLMVFLALQQVTAVLQLFTGLWITNNALYFLLDTIPSLLMGVVLILATLRSESKLKGYLMAGQISLYLVAISPFHGLFALSEISPVAIVFFNYPPFYMALGLCIELFCFALALAYRSQLVELEKNALQRHYTERLEGELEARTREVQEQSLRLERQHIRQLELGFEQQLAGVQMQALRSQMNPHFIFNCLNSIQLYTTSNDAAKASDYLNRFSQLIRLVLENSRSERVTLQNELEALELYLQMEAMRFKDKLRYQIDISPGLDTELIEIPPLLLQPYVENAIWHGLMHKPDGGWVHVRIEDPEADWLRVTITDDGIGRGKAAELKSKSATLHKSFGMKVTGERIGLINQLYKTRTQVQIHDLTDAEGEPAGTEVVLEIPI